MIHNNDKPLSLFKIPLKRFKSPTPPMPTCHMPPLLLLLLFLNVNDD
jgi:hypothetical protein